MNEKALREAQALNDAKKKDMATVGVSHLCSSHNLQRMSQKDKEVKPRPSYEHISLPPLPTGHK